MSIHFNPSLTFVGKVFLGLHCNCKLPALPTYIRLGWKLMELTNTIAYYNTATITAQKVL